jgi:hypothetical protein
MRKLIVKGPTAGNTGEFASCRSYWMFAKALMDDDENGATVKDFLQAVVVTSEPRRVSYPKDTKLWRAQLHERGQTISDLKEPFGAKRMKPLPTCRAGRINAENDPCLYTAEDENTAMSEVRPWIGAVGTLAQISTTRQLTLVYCAGDFFRDEDLAFLHTLRKEPSPEDREHYVWGQINAAFRAPTTSADTAKLYRPTQVLAQKFRSEGVDNVAGITYSSSIGSKRNFVFFDLNTVVIGERRFFTKIGPDEFVVDDRVWV